MKILNEDINESKGYLEKVTPLLEICNYRINLSIHRIKISKHNSALKKLSSKDSHKVLSQTNVLIKEDSFNKIVKQLFEGLKTNEN